ncbi:MAG: aminotransferase class IV [Prolixibacteraceae bacterium]|jgi:4-amino-4-deoxychorismate lyase|nr:aminotransferase class IV [Prolixibacteraceae bacterium]
MFQLIESIRIENKQLHHIDLHNRRFNNACKQLFGFSNSIDLSKSILIPDSISNQRYKCRVTFDGKKLNIEINQYEQRIINSLKVVESKSIDYSFKTSNRSLLNNAFDKRGNCDDIIISKNGFVTDAWAANIILFDGTKWVTPTTPLLKGVQREFLLSNGTITEIAIRTNNLLSFKKIKLINALIDFNRAPEIDTKNIIIS